MVVLESLVLALASRLESLLTFLSADQPNTAFVGAKGRVAPGGNYTVGAWVETAKMRVIRPLAPTRHPTPMPQARNQPSDDGESFFSNCGPLPVKKVKVV